MDAAKVDEAAVTEKNLKNMQQNIRGLVVSI